MLCSDSSQTRAVRQQWESCLREQLRIVREVFPESAMPLNWEDERSVAAHSAINALKNDAYLRSAGVKSVTSSKLGCFSRITCGGSMPTVTFDPVPAYTTPESQCTDGERQRARTEVERCARRENESRGSSDELTAHSRAQPHDLGASDEQTALATPRLHRFRFQSSFPSLIIAVGSALTPTLDDAGAEEALHDSLCNSQSARLGLLARPSIVVSDIAELHSPTDSTKSLASTLVSVDECDQAWFDSERRVPCSLASYSRCSSDGLASYSPQRRLTFGLAAEDDRRYDSSGDGSHAQRNPLEEAYTETQLVADLFRRVGAEFQTRATPSAKGRRGIRALKLL